MSNQKDSVKKTQIQTYGEVMMDIAYAGAGVIAGTVLSYQVKKLAIKATAKDGQTSTEPSIIAKLSPTLVGAAATYGAIATEDRGMRMFFVGMAASSSAASLYGMVGNEITAKWAGQTLGILPETQTLPPRQASRYAEPEDVEFEEETPDEEISYDLNLPAQLRERESSQMQGLSAPSNENEEVSDIIPYSIV